MAAKKIGTVKSGSGKIHTVEWDPYTHDVYIDGGYIYIGKASSAADAMRMAEAYLYNK
jgi:hypothetical protein